MGLPSRGATYEREAHESGAETEQTAGLLDPLNEEEHDGAEDGDGVREREEEVVRVLLKMEIIYR